MPDDISATGIEIHARPPGKKRQPLSMLSGGERALTAVSLLLAMLEVRPVPFCVLDEVDAALDEANVGRFSQALRGLAEQTQFIVITHNRGTIEGADALYGVTIGDDAVSRVVSLRLPGAAANGHGTTTRVEIDDELAGGDRSLDAATNRASRRRARASSRGCAASSAGRWTTRPGKRSRRRSSPPTSAPRSRRSVVERARARRDVADAEAAVEAELLALFAPRDPTPWPRIPAPGVPAVVLVVGVNGTGKTTTVAKLGNRFATRGARSSWPPPTRSAPRPSSSSRRGRSARTCRSLPTQPAPIPRPWSTTRWTRPRPATPTW